MTTPIPMRVDPDLLRGLGSEWHRLADAMDTLDPGGAVAGGAASVGGSATAEVMSSAGDRLNGGGARTAARLRRMADAARRTADYVRAADDDFASALRRIDGGR